MPLKKKTAKRQSRIVKQMGQPPPSPKRLVPLKKRIEKVSTAKKRKKRASKRAPRGAAN